MGSFKALPFGDFVSSHPAVLDLLRIADRVASTEVAVLIQGESGTGKELIAQRLHAGSLRRNERLVSINCGALHDTLLLSELFGHEKGAFTGALYLKKGIAEQAHHGTLFLDEIGEMGLEAQAKLLRFLQSGEIYRVGGKDPIHINARIIAATNKDLEARVKEGRFREDLLYRINTVTLRLPPLRKRKGDVILLLNHFLKDSGKTLNSRAEAILEGYAWPGNVRELQNLTERFKVLSDNPQISEEDIPGHIIAPGVESDGLGGIEIYLLDEVEKKHILRVLAHFHGNKTRAATAMGITVKTLYNKLATYEKSIGP